MKETYHKDYIRGISTGGSGGGAHATMFASTSNNPDP